MEQYISKTALVAEIKKRIKTLNEKLIKYPISSSTLEKLIEENKKILSFLDTLEVKDVNLMLHTIIAEGCDWLATHTNLSHDEIEGCRNLMLTVKEEQLKAQKGE